MVISLRASLIALGLSAVPFAAGAQQVVTQAGVAGPTQAPPAIVAETPSPSPGPGHTWVAGYWTWDGSRYSWNAGHWERPPQAAQSWEAPRWEREGGRYRFRAGRWAAPPGVVAQPAVPVAVPVAAPVMLPGVQPGRQPAGVAVMQPGVPVAVPVMQPGVAVPAVAAPAVPVAFVQVPMQPPRPRMERRPRMIPPGQSWVPGYWAWNANQYEWTPGHVEAPPRPRAQWVSPRIERRGRNTVFIPGRWR